MSIIDGIKIINGVVNGIDVANSLFEFGKNIKGEDYLKLHYNLVYTGGTMWTKLGEYNETNEISLFRRESEKDDFLIFAASSATPAILQIINAASARVIVLSGLNRPALSPLRIPMSANVFTASA